MPSRPKSSCRVVGCPYPAHHRGRCTTHARQYHTDTHHNAGFYKSAVWRKARAKHLSANPWCIECGGPANTVDHRVPITKGG